MSGELRSATPGAGANSDAPLEAIRSTTSLDRRADSGPGTAHSEGASASDGRESSPEQPAQRSRAATLTIELRLTEAQHALAQRDPNTLGARRWEAEHLIQAEQKRWGYDWRDIECRLLTPDGALVEVVRFEPLAAASGLRSGGPDPFDPTWEPDPSGYLGLAAREGLRVVSDGPSSSEDGPP